MPSIGPSHLRKFHPVYISQFLDLTDDPITNQYFSSSETFFHTLQEYIRWWNDKTQISPDLYFLSQNHTKLHIFSPELHRAYQPSSQSTIEPIDHWAYRPSSLSTIKPIDHQAYQPSSLSTIEPIDHWAYWPSSLSTIKPNNHQAYWQSSLTTTKPINHINHRAYWPSCLLTIKPINHWAYWPLVFFLDF